MRNDLLEAALDELAGAGIRGSVLNGGKHPKIRWQYNGAARMITISKTTRDHFAARKVKADIRRQLRADGLLKKHEDLPVPPLR
jgi:hypothetical protein